MRLMKIHFKRSQSLAHSLLSGLSNDLVLQDALVEYEQGGHGTHTVLLGQVS